MEAVPSVCFFLRDEECFNGIACALDMKTNVLGKLHRFWEQMFEMLTKAAE